MFLEATTFLNLSKLLVGISHADSFSSIFFNGVNLACALCTRGGKHDKKVHCVCVTGG